MEVTTKVPLVELPIVAFFLAIAAGAMDGYAYYTTKLFATFQSGNIILTGFTLATDDFTKLYGTLYSIAAFSFGAMVLAFIRDTYVKNDKTWTFLVLAFEMIVMFLLAINSLHGLFSSLGIVYILAFLAGFQGNAFHYIDKMLYGNIAVTLNVQLAASYFGEWLIKLTSNKSNETFKKFLDYFIILIGFAFGAFISAILTKEIGSFTLLLPVLCLGSIFMIGKLYLKKNPNVEIDAD